MTNATLNDFLRANQVTTPMDVMDAGTIADTTSAEAVADDMLDNWTFDGALEPDRQELVEWLRTSPSPWA